MDQLRTLLIDQLTTAWSLLEYHLNDLDDAECLWRPSQRGLHVESRSGKWVAQWPETESYALGPPSIAWLTWHIGFWWSMVLDHSFGDGTLQRSDIYWPGSAEATRVWLRELHGEWIRRLRDLPSAEMMSVDRTRWPLSDKPFTEVVLWLNLELMKNAAEVGYCRFLYAVRQTR